MKIDIFSAWKLWMNFSFYPPVLEQNFGKKLVEFTKPWFMFTFQNWSKKIIFKFQVKQYRSQIKFFLTPLIRLCNLSKEFKTFRASGYLYIFDNYFLGQILPCANFIQGLEIIEIFTIRYSFPLNSNLNLKMTEYCLLIQWSFFEF